MTAVNEIINRSTHTDAEWEALLHDLELQKVTIGKLSTAHKTLSDMIRSVATRLPAESPPQVDVREKRWSEEIPVLLFSDAQIGSYVSKYMTGGLAEYSKLEFIKRIKRLTKHAAECLGIQRAGGITMRQMNIHVLGDVVQGETVFKGQGFQLDALQLEQSLFLANKIVDEVFVPLSRLFERLEIFCIPGNHGRQYGTSRLANWDYVSYMFWKVRMEKFEHVKFYISASPFLIYELFPGQVHALIHGNQAKGWMGYPYYGIDRLYHRMITLAGLYIKFLHHGHHHQPSMQDTHIGKKIGNGSIEGGSEYSVCDLVTANVPQQLLCSFNKKRMTYQYWLELADAPDLKKSKAGSLYTPVFEDEFPEPEVDGGS